MIFLDFFFSQIEVDVGTTVDDAFLLDELHPKSSLHRPKFAKPKGPANRGPRRLLKDGVQQWKCETRMWRFLKKNPCIVQEKVWMLKRTRECYRKPRRVLNFCTYRVSVCAPTRLLLPALRLLGGLVFASGFCFGCEFIYLFFFDVRFINRADLPCFTSWIYIHNVL